MGSRPHGRKIQAFVRVNGQFLTKTFARGTGQRTIDAWEREMKVAHAKPAAAARRFTDDAIAYLKAVKEMPSYADRARDIQFWIDAFGERDRHAIEPHEIAAQLHAWRATKAASTCNHRRTALMHLWTQLDGKHQPNPVKAVPPFPEPDAEPRGVPDAIWQLLFDQMDDSKTKARLQVLRWTGWPHAQLMRLEPKDLDLTAGTAYIRRRRKGKGAKARTLPLHPEAVAALKAFARWDAWGEFSTASMRKSVVCARKKLLEDDEVPEAVKAVLRPLRVYDLRHSFGEAVARLTKDDRALQELMLHAKPEQTQRYTVGAVAPRVAAAMASLATLWQLSPAPNGKKRRDSAVRRHRSRAKSSTKWRGRRDSNSRPPA